MVRFHHHFFLVLFLCLVLAELSVAQLISTIAGTQGDGKPAIEAQLSGPLGMCIDASGNIFIADTGNRLIRKIDHSTGVITTVAGNGEQGSAGDGGQATQAQLHEPVGIELDALGNLYISDRTSAVVRKVEASTGVISTIAGIGGAPGFEGDGGLAVNARLNGPRNVCVDEGNNIYIVEESGHRVRKIDYLSGVITTFAGTGNQGFYGDGELATSAQLSYPTDILIDSNGDLIIVDKGNNRIRKVDLSTNIISTIVGNGTTGLGGDNGDALNAELSSPSAITEDVDGNLFIVDSEARVRKVDIVTGIITTIAGSSSGILGFSGDGGPALEALLFAPRGLAFDLSGELCIAEYGPFAKGRIRKVDNGGVISTIAGNGGFSGDGDLANAASLDGPVGIAFDSEDNLLIADASNHRIRKIDNLTGVITTIAGTGIGGFSGDDIPATTAALNYPLGLTLDESDNIYFTDASNSRIRRIDAVSGEITTIAGNGVFGFNGDNLAATATHLNAPSGLAIDVNGDIYFSDTYNNRVRKISAATNLITTIAGDGVFGFGGDDGLATNAQLAQPAGIVLAAGHLYIADKFNQRVRGVDLSTNIISTYAGGGGLQHDGVSPLDTDLGFPTGLTLDPVGNLVITSEIGKVRVVDNNTNLITTLAGAGGQGFSGDGGPANLAKMNPSSAAFDAEGNLYVSDSGNDRIRKVLKRNDQTITFNEIQSPTVGDAPIILDNTIVFASTGLPLTFSSSNNSVATISENQIVILGAGSAVITAYQAGNLDFAPASQTQTLVVNKGNPVIFFTSLSTGEKNTTLELSIEKGGSTGPVTYSVVNSSGLAQINGNMLSLLGVGMVTVTATVSEDQNYLEGVAEQIITIEKTTPVLKFTSPTNSSIDDPIVLSVDSDGSSGLVTFSILSSNPTVNPPFMGASLTGNSLNSDTPGTVRIRAFVEEDENFKATSIDKVVRFNIDDDILPDKAYLWGATSLGGSARMGNIFSLREEDSSPVSRYEFFSDPSGHNPSFVDMYETPSGTLIGGVGEGGYDNRGVLFEFNPATKNYEVKFHFSKETGSGPSGPIIQTATGNLLGMTYWEGSLQAGTLYEYDLETDAFEKTHDFNYFSGANPSYIFQASNGEIYGIAKYGGLFNGGTLFAYRGGAVVPLTHFEFNTTGTQPTYNLVESGGKLYGTTTEGSLGGHGVLFSLNLADEAFAVVHQFSSSEYPGYLAVAPDGNLYGSNFNGGSENVGALFKFDIATLQYTVLQNFSSLSDGSYPQNIVWFDGAFYGTTSYNGPFDGGTLFKLEYPSDVFSVVANFMEANQPRSLSLHSNGNFYGMCARPNGDPAGGIFEFALDEEEPTVIHTFQNKNNGFNPFGSMLQSTDGSIYGLSSGGKFGEGTLFRFDPVSFLFEKKIDFNNEWGILQPMDFLQKPDGNLLIATYVGDILEFDVLSNTVSKIAEVNDIGSIPQDIIWGNDGMVYGTTLTGGNFLVGAVFRFNPENNQVTKLFDFNNSTGEGRMSLLTMATTGILYGYTVSGGEHGGGVLFEYDFQTNNSSVKHNFTVTTGTNPRTSLIEAPNGTLYGTTTSGGANGFGTLFSYSPVGSSFETLYNFDVGFSGGAPHGDLVWVEENKFCGITQFGGQYGNGTVFCFNIADNTISIKSNFDQDFQSPTGSILLAKLNQTIVFEALVEKEFGQEPFMIEAFSSSGLPLSFEISNPTVARIEDGKIILLGTGSTEIIARQAGTFDYMPANPISRTLVVSKGNQTINFPVITVDRTEITLTALASSGLPVSYVSSNESIASISGNKLSILGKGTVTITASQGGSDNFNAASMVEQIINIDKLPQLVSFEAIPVKSFGNNKFELSASATSGLVVAFVSSDLSIASVEGNQVTIHKAGTVTITASQPGNEDYLPAAPVSQQLTISKGSQVITFDELNEAAFDADDIILQATSSSNLPITFISSDPSIASVNGTTLTIHKAGSINITATQPGNDNYFPALDVTQTLVILKAPQAITFSSIDERVFGSMPFEVLAESTSGLVVGFESSNPQVASIEGNTVTIHNAGSVTITANQPGDENYLAAPSVSQTLLVTKASQEITFAELTQKTLGDAPFTLSATASSMLPVVFTNNSDRISITNEVVTMLRAGRVTIQANQAGDENYQPASTVEQTFCINPAKPVISVDFTNPAAPVLTSGNGSGNQWYFNDVALPGATAPTYTASESGSYTVISTADDCMSEESDPVMLVITSLFEESQQVSIYPNPATHFVTVRIGGNAGSPVQLQVVNTWGQVVYSRQAVAGRDEELDMRTWQAGIYWLRLTTEGKVISRAIHKRDP